jgi:SNF2 family DNA or RNA helicase
MVLRLQREANLSAKHQGFFYQVSAVNAVKDLEYAAVFHEQGLGKTKIGVDVALWWLDTGVADSVLIVTKKGLIQNWSDELKTHTHLFPRILTQDRKNNFYAFNSPSRLYLTHYETLISEQKRLQLFLRTRKVGIILDEAHKIKNPDAGVAKALFALAPGFVRKIIMTGTPVANRPYDLWAQIFFLDGGESLGMNFKEFRRSLDLANELAFSPEKARVFQDNLSHVYGKIQAFSVRETKDALEIQLPNKVFRNLEVEMAWRQSELYNAVRVEFQLYVVKNNIAKLDESGEILKRLLRLVQIASNPKLVDESYQEIPAKFAVLEQLLFQIIEKEEKAIIWTSYTDNVSWLTRELKQFGAVMVHGKLSYPERQHSLTKFKNDPETRVLIATPGSAKEGLTLTVANHAIFYDRTFSLDDYLQAQDRIHRISQTRTCYVTNLIAKDSIDEWIDVLLSAKHLAAQLAQGDIGQEEYESNADYAFGEMIRELLNPTHNGVTNEQRNTD